MKWTKVLQDSSMLGARVLHSCIHWQKWIRANIRSRISVQHNASYVLTTFKIMFSILKTEHFPRHLQDSCKSLCKRPAEVKVLHSWRHYASTLHARCARAKQDRVNYISCLALQDKSKKPSSRPRLLLLHNTALTFPGSEDHYWRGPDKDGFEWIYNLHSCYLILWQVILAFILWALS